jgi:Ca-activated chloride channel family protein
MAALRIATLEGVSRVGLVAFAAAAHLLVPPTVDRGLVLLHLDGLTPDALTAQGTDLASALRAAVEALPPAEAGRRRAVVLITDGEGFQGDNPLEAASVRAEREGVAVHAVVVGTPGGARVPGRAGETTRARPDALRRVARETGGLTASAAAGGEVSALLAALGGAQAAPGLRGGVGRSGEDAPGPHLAPALALVALLALLGQTAQTGGPLRRAS